jgi:hypothetical protein
VNRRGDAAAVWHDWHEGRFYAALRPRGGSWQAPVPITPSGADPSLRSVALSESGEVMVLWQGSNGTIRFGGRAASGDLLPVESVSAPARWGDYPELGVDDDGNAVALWTEGQERGYANAALTANRPQGESFGEPRPVPTKDGANTWGAASLAVAGDGLVSVAFDDGGAMNVASGRFGDPLELKRRFGKWYTGEAPVLVTSHDGHSMLAWDADGDHWVTSRRVGDGDFGPVEDLDVDCGHAEYVNLAIDDSGLAAATLLERGRVTLTTGTPPVGPPHQGCAHESAYRDPDAPPAAEPTPHNPFPPATGNPMMPSGRHTSALRMAARLRLGAVRTRVRSTAVRARLPIDCGGACVVSTAAVLKSPRGATIARASTGRRSLARPRAISLTLRPAARWRRTVRRGKAMLKVRIVARYPAGLKRVTRALQPVRTSRRR